MENKAVKKYGFLMCLALLMGTVIGVGIFFKNADIYGSVGGNGILGITAWAIGGIGAICFGMAFMEIASASQSSNSGIALYAKLFINSKIGRVVRHTMGNIYLPIIIFTIAYYTTLASIWAIAGGQEAGDKWANAIGGQAIFQLLITFFAMCYTIFLVLMISYKETFSKWVQMITVVLKIIPLFLVGIIGLFIVNSDAGAFKESGLGDPEKIIAVANKTHIELVLITLPAVLFSFDGFLMATFIQHDVRNAKRNVPLSLVVGLTLVTLLYVLVSIGTLNLTATGSVAVAITKIFKNPIVNQVFSRLLFFLIFISAFGGLNGVTLATLKLNQSCIEDQFLIANTSWQRINLRIGARLTNVFLTLALILIWALIMTIPTITSQAKVNFINDTSNAAVVMAFFFYSLIIGFGLLNRFRKKVTTNKVWYFIPAAIVSILFIVLILGYKIYNMVVDIVVAKPEELLNQILKLVVVSLVLGLPWFGLLIKDEEARKLVIKKMIL